MCKSYLETLSDVLGDYAERGVEVVAVSMDSVARTRKARMDWAVEAVPIGYGMTESTARAWGLYLSQGIKDGEPDLFSEPGFFLVRPDGTLYYAAVNSAPWGARTCRRLSSPSTSSRRTSTRHAARRRLTRRSRWRKRSSTHPSGAPGSRLLRRASG